MTLDRIGIAGDRYKRIHNAPTAMNTPADIQPLLADLRAALDDLYGDRFARLVLYGSYARGDTHDESDVDVLVVLHGSVQPGREIRRMSTVRTQIGLRYERALSLLPVSTSDYQDRSSAWVQSARKGGYRCECRRRHPACSPLSGYSRART